MAEQITVRVSYRLQFESERDRREAVEMTVEDDPSDVVLRARVRAQFWPDVAASMTGTVTAVIVEAVRRPGEY